MSLTKLIFRELAYHRLNTALILVSVLVAVATLVGSVTILRKHDLTTARILEAKQAQTDKLMRDLEEEARKLGVKMGFNAVILPKGQSLSDIFADDYAAKTMPEEYATRLAKFKVATINHVLPILEQRVKWPEQNGRTIFMAGVLGEAYIQSAKQTPILEPVAKDGIVLGDELARTLKLKVGDKVAFFGHELTVSKVHDPRNAKEDITAWVHLHLAQEILNKKGLVNAIMALECGCATNLLASIRTEITRYLPDTEVVELDRQKVIARAEARTAAEQTAQAALAQERASRAELRLRNERLFMVLVPIVLVASALTISLLTLLNVNDRTAEIGILRAIGLRARHILAIFLSKAFIIGVLGAIFGAAAGLLLAMLWPQDPAPFGELIDPKLLAATLPSAPALALLATVVPAMLAAQKDPATILQRD